MPRLLVVLRLLVSIVLVACSRSSSQKPGDDDGVVEKVDGAAKIDGKKVGIAHCKAVEGEEDHEALEITLADGTKIVDEPQVGLSVDGTKVECSKRASSSSSGRSVDDRWTTGKLAVTCDTKKGELVLDVTYDCGSKSRPMNLVK